MIVATWARNDGGFGADGSDVEDAANIWLHELAHLEGLVHRPRSPDGVAVHPSDVCVLLGSELAEGVCNTNYFHPRPLMCGTLAVNHRVCNAECNTFLEVMRRSRHWWCAVLVASAAQAQQGSLEDYVRQGFVHGVPYLETREWGSDVDVGPLIKMLDDEAAQRHWTSVVGVLGIVGNDDAFCPLVEFLGGHVESPVGKGIGRSPVPLALGYLVNSGTSGRAGRRTPQSRTALRILIKGVDPEFWRGRWQRESRAACNTRSPSVASERVRRALARRALLGLTLSGRSESVFRLDRLSSSVARGRAEAEIFSDLLPEMATTARRSRTMVWRPITENPATDRMGGVDSKPHSP